MSRLLLMATLLVLLAPAAVAAEGGRTVEGPNYTLFIPAGLDPGDLRPMVMAFAPDGNPAPLVTLWQPHAARYQWFLLGFKDYRSTSDVTPMLESLRKLIKELASVYPIDPRCLVASGLSGGGMFSHILSVSMPEAIVAVVPNTGMSNPDLRDRTPRGKLAVFLASPTDFRYQEMKADQKRLQDLGWETRWIEFKGGHTWAPPAAYKQAADWLAGMLNWARRKK